MPANVFVAFDHADQRQVGGFKLLRQSSSHPLDFRDHSLKGPVVDRSGRPITYPPSDPRSKPVRDEIIDKFSKCSKLVVLIGEETYLSEWVDWEIKTFYSMKYPLSGASTWRRIRGMYLKEWKGQYYPGALGDRSTQMLAWDPVAMDTWLDLDPDA